MNINIKRNLIILILAVSLLSSGCSFGQKVEQQQDKSLKTSSIISPDVKVNDKYYRGVLPYKSSPINGMLREIPSRLDMKHFELGLLEIAKTAYDPSEYIFQEGQILSMNEIEPILNADQYPQFQNFIYGVTEHDYLLDDGKYGGIVIGILVSPKYDVKDESGNYIRDSYGIKLSKLYTDEELKEKSKLLIKEINTVIRRKVYDSSIIFGVMKAETLDLKIPGTFFLTGKVNEKQNSIDKWNEMHETYIFLPVVGKYSESYDAIGIIFNHFKEKMEQYLPGFAGITGLAKTQNEDLIEVTVKINTEFDSTVETIQFTQFAISMLSNYFPDDIHLNLYVTTIDRPKAIYVRKSNGDDFMHIYRD